MLFVANSAFDISEIISEYPEESIQRQLLNKMSESSEKYQYDNTEQLKFELDMRKEIVDSALNLNDSNLSFAVFRRSRCNPEYWTRTPNGGFLLNSGASSGAAISDIFTNGDYYATECATAMVIVYYKALLNIYGKDLFDKIFPRIYLMGWDITEPLLQEAGNMHNAKDMLLGDRGYFNNPDYDRSSPEWEGENVIFLPDSLYYGHGIGISNADKIISELNSRRQNGSTTSAYLLNAVGRPDFKKLSDVYQTGSVRRTAIVWKPFPEPISAI